MKRCVPAFKSEGKSSDKARQMCNAMWYQHKRSNNSEEVTMFNGSYNSIKFGKDIEVHTEEINGVTYDVVPIVAAVGDIFYQGVFVSKDILKAVAEQWESTIHDISHKATSSLGFRNGLGFVESEDISNVVGFHKNARFDEDIGGVVMDAYISHNAPEYEAWRNYIDICMSAGRIPNTSMYAMVRYGVMKAKDLPEGVTAPMNYQDYKGNIMYVKALSPAAVTTCLQGKCNDKDGCGVGVGSNEGDCDSCDTELDEERVNYLKNRIKEFETKKRENNE